MVMARIEKAVDEELARFQASGPTAEELQRVKTQHLAHFIRGLERIGGFGGKSDILAMNQVFAGSPDFYKVTLKHTREATAKDLQNSARQWLSDGVYILEVHPFSPCARLLLYECRELAAITVQIPLDAQSCPPCAPLGGIAVGIMTVAGIPG